MAKKHITMSIFAVLVAMSVMAGQAKGAIWSVSGGNSSLGDAPVNLMSTNPTQVLDSGVTNTAMTGFDEKQGVTISSGPYTTDSGSIANGMTVDSHMIFLNVAEGAGTVTHDNVAWTFSRPIVGVISNQAGTLEAASSGELGAATTTYPSAFADRGLEPADGYTVLGNMITVSMRVDQPGDWMRVVTSGPVVPVPGAVLLGILGLGMAGIKLRKFA